MATNAPKPRRLTAAQRNAEYLRNLDRPHAYQSPVPPARKPSRPMRAPKPGGTR